MTTINKTRLLFIGFILQFSSVLWAQKTLNVYVWAGEIPNTLIQQFERETGIKVNFSTYDSNETMYAKIRATKHSIYDIIMPSANYVTRMKNQGLLTKLDHSKLPLLKNLDPLFSHNKFDNNNHYSVPLIWGVTGIFYNKAWIKNPPTTWRMLWETQWKNKLLLFDDAREIFSITLISLGFSPNDPNPQHIKMAYKKLLRLIPNIKLFSSDGLPAIMIDEDALLGTAWNGDIIKARTENKNLEFIYPTDGVTLWSECLAITANPPHLNEAYQFINFLLKPESAAIIALEENYAITNAKGKAMLPPSIRNDAIVYPSKEALKNAYFQEDVDDNAIALYNEYWQALKMSM